MSPARRVRPKSVAGKSHWCCLQRRFRREKRRPVDGRRDHQLASGFGPTDVLSFISEAQATDSDNRLAIDVVLRSRLVAH